MRVVTWTSSKTTDKRAQLASLSRRMSRHDHALLYSDNIEMMTKSGFVPFSRCAKTVLELHQSRAAEAAPMCPFVLLTIGALFLVSGSPFTSLSVYNSHRCQASVAP